MTSGTKSDNKWQLVAQLVTMYFNDLEQIRASRTRILTSNIYSKQQQNFSTTKFSKYLGTSSYSTYLS